MSGAWFAMLCGGCGLTWIAVSAFLWGAFDVQSLETDGGLACVLWPFVVIGLPAYGMFLLGRWLRERRAMVKLPKAQVVK